MAASAKAWFALVASIVSVDYQMNRMPLQEIASKALDVRAAPYWFGSALLFGYAGVGAVVYSSSIGNAYHLQLIELVIAAVCLIFFGRKIPFFDFLVTRRDRILICNPGWVLLPLWICFIIFIVTAIETAVHVPLISSFMCVSQEQLNVQREQFLKAREGWGASLPYFNGLFIGAIIPYSMAHLFLLNSKLRWTCVAIFSVYSMSFLEKALFLKAAFPIGYVFFHTRKYRLLALSGVVSVVALLFISVAATSICRVVPLPLPAGANFQPSPPIAPAGSTRPFFAAGYEPAGVLEQLVWRSVSVPLFTAVDALKTFDSEYGGRPFFGTTSLAIAKLFGHERVWFDRKVFERQWGQNATGTGSANSVFITEAYVNFGWFGVVAFSLAIGIMLRLMGRSSDVAFQALWPLFCFTLYSGGLIGVLLSNGFLVVFIFVFLFRLPSRERVLSTAN